MSDDKRHWDCPMPHCVKRIPDSRIIGAHVIVFHHQKPTTPVTDWKGVTEDMVSWTSVTAEEIKAAKAILYHRSRSSEIRPSKPAAAETRDKSEHDAVHRPIAGSFDPLSGRKSTVPEIPYHDTKKRRVDVFLR